MAAAFKPRKASSPDCWRSSGGSVSTKRPYPRNDRLRFARLSPASSSPPMQRPARSIAASELFQIADLSQVWVQAEVYEKDLGRIQLGQIRFDQRGYVSGSGVPGTRDLHQRHSRSRNPYGASPLRVVESDGQAQARHVRDGAACRRRSARMPSRFPLKPFSRSKARTSCSSERARQHSKRKASRSDGRFGDSRRSLPDLKAAKLSSQKALSI